MALTMVTRLTGILLHTTGILPHNFRCLPHHRNLEFKAEVEKLQAAM